MISSRSVGRRGALGIGFAWAMALPLAVLGLAGPGSAGASTPPVAGQVDLSFEAPALDERVFSVAVQPDGKILIGGVFTKIDGEDQRSLARLNVDGSLDGTFVPTTLFRQVQTIAVQPDGKVLIGGNVFSGTRNALIRLNADGSIDEGFPDPGLWRPDGDNTGAVESIALQPDGKIVIGGNFTKLGGASGEVRDRVARLNANGTIDFSFAPPEPGPNGEVKTVALDPDGKVLIGGTFTSLGGVAREQAARLGVSGTLDESFINPEVGAGSGTATVESIVPQPDGKVLIGGSFTCVGAPDPLICPEENERTGAARLETVGTLDEGYDNPSFNGVVNSVALQRDGEALFGGVFPELATGRGDHLARLKANNGALDTTFTSPFPNPSLFRSVESLALQPDGKLVFSFINQSSPPTVYKVERVFSTTPQAAPTSVSATAGDGQATVSWTAVPGEITEYSVVATGPGGDTPACTTTSATSCMVSGLTNGTSYTFTVEAENWFGLGPKSSPSAPVTPQPPTYQLSVIKPGNGTGTVNSSPSGIDCGATCTADFSTGAMVTLTATAASDSTFSGWSGACSGTGSCAVTMSEARSVTATFTADSPPPPPTTHQLSVTRSGTGTGTVSSSPSGIDCGATCTADFSTGAMVTLTATAASDSTFSGWSGACSGTGSCAVTMSEARSVTATFTADSPPPPPTATVTVSGLKAKVTRKSVVVNSKVKVSGAGKIAQRVITGRGKKTRTWCSTSKTVSAAGTHNLRCNLGNKGRKALRKGTLNFTFLTTFTPTVGKAVSADRKLTVKRKR